MVRDRGEVRSRCRAPTTTAGPRSPRIASAVVSSAMTLAHGARRASAAASARTTAPRCATGTCIPSCPQSANESSGSFIGLTYFSVTCWSSCMDAHDAREVVGVGRLHARLQLTAARFPVRRERRRRAVHEAGQDGTRRVVREAEEEESGGVGGILLRCAVGRRDAGTAAADVVAIARQLDAGRREQHLPDLAPDRFREAQQGRSATRRRTRRSPRSSAAGRG